MSDTLGQLDFFSVLNDQKKKKKYNPNHLKQNGRFIVYHSMEFLSIALAGSKAQKSWSSTAS